MLVVVDLMHLQEQKDIQQLVVSLVIILHHLVIFTEHTSLLHQVLLMYQHLVVLVILLSIL